MKMRVRNKRKIEAQGKGGDLRPQASVDEFTPQGQIPHRFVNVFAKLVIFEEFVINMKTCKKLWKCSVPKFKRIADSIDFSELDITLLKF